MYQDLPHGISIFNPTTQVENKTDFSLKVKNIFLHNSLLSFPAGRELFSIFLTIKISFHCVQIF